MQARLAAGRLHGQLAIGSLNDRLDVIAHKDAAGDPAGEAHHVAAGRLGDRDQADALRPDEQLEMLSGRGVDRQLGAPN